MKDPICILKCSINNKLDESKKYLGMNLNILYQMNSIFINLGMIFRETFCIEIII